MDRSQQCSAKYTGHAHHVEWVQRPIVEALEEEDEAEDRRHSKGRSKEPSRLSQWVNEEHGHEYGNWAEKAKAL